jgi:hypothetical protein
MRIIHFACANFQPFYRTRSVILSLRTAINSGPHFYFREGVVVETLGLSRSLILLQLDPKVSLLALTLDQHS